MGTSEHSDATEHHLTDMPVVLAGTAGGAIKSGLHQRFPDQSLSRMLLTCLHAVGVNEPSVGAGEAAASQPFSELLVG